MLLFYYYINIYIGSLHIHAYMQSHTHWEHIRNTLGTQMRTHTHTHIQDVCTLEDYDVEAEATLEAYVPLLGFFFYF
jgi:hypothetical protein